MPTEENRFFEIGYLDPQDLGAFSPLILADTKKQMQSKEPYFALGLTMDNTAVGALCGKAVDPITFDVQSLFVAPSYRHMGGANLLMGTLLSLLPDQISVITVDYVADDHEKKALDGFLAGWGALKSDNPLGLYRTTGKEMMESQFVKGGAASKSARTFSSLSADELKQLEVFASENALEKLQEGFDGEGIDREHSICLIEDDRIESG